VPRPCLRPSPGWFSSRACRRPSPRRSRMRRFKLALLAPVPPAPPRTPSRLGERGRRRLGERGRRRLGKRGARGTGQRRLGFHQLYHRRYYRRPGGGKWAPSMRGRRSTDADTPTPADTVDQGAAGSTCSDRRVRKRAIHRTQ
jgi:hypothetical protein